MATELHLSHSPVHGMRRQIRALKSSDDARSSMLNEVIESNLKTQQAVAEVSKNINEFVNLIKSVSDSEEPAAAQRSSAEPNEKASSVEQKLDKIATQNLQLIQLISELVMYLKKEKPQQEPQFYGGSYPPRQLR